jgi:hypothetical protein
VARSPAAVQRVVTQRVAMHYAALVPVRSMVRRRVLAAPPPPARDPST